MAFDPDAYLSGGTAVKEFDPDAYLAGDTELPEVGHRDYSTPAGLRDDAIPTLATQEIDPEEYDQLFYKTGLTKRQRESANAPLREAMQVPAVAPETITRVLQALNTTDEQGPVQQGIDESIAKAGSAMTSGEGVASLPLYIFPPTAVGLQAENTAELPAQVRDAIERARQGDIKGAASTGTDALLNALMTAGVVHGGAKLMGGERIPMRVEPTLAEGITQPRAELPPVEPSPVLPEVPVTPRHTAEISAAPADARTYIAQRVSEGLTREQALTEWQQKVAEHKVKMAEGLPVGSQVKTADGIFERTNEGWNAVEGGGGKGVLFSNPEGEIIRIGDPMVERALPTGPETAPPAPVMTPGAAKQLGKLKAYVEKSKKLGQQVDPKVEAKIAEIEGVPPEAPVQAQEAPRGVQGAETPTGAAEPPPSGAGAPPKVVDVTQDHNFPPELRGPTLALKLDDGTILYARDTRLHSQVLEQSGVDPTRVVDSGVYRGEGVFESKTPDTVEIYPQNVKTPPPEVPPSERGYAGMEPLPQKPSKIGQSIEAKAVEAKLTKGFPETAGYNPITIKDQAARASDLVKQNPSRAGAIIRGEEPLPPEIKGTSLITAMEEHLLRNPSAQGAYELANSRLVSLTSEAAQEMRLMAERVPDGITAKFAEIKAAREKGAELRKETKAKVKKEITNEVVKQASKRPTWEAFVREIVC